MKKNSGFFDKFAKKKSNAAIKEQFRQEKRKVKKEREAFFDQKRAEARKEKVQGTRDKEQGTRNKEQGLGEKFEKKNAKRIPDAKPLDSARGKLAAHPSTSPGTNRQQTPRLRPVQADSQPLDSARGKLAPHPSTSPGTNRQQTPRLRSGQADSQPPDSARGKLAPHPSTSPGTNRQQTPRLRPGQADSQLTTDDSRLTTPDSHMPLNKYIAHSGVAARREAADIVRQGKVKVNNVVITEPGHKVAAGDDIKINGKKIHLAKNLVYILINKPKDYITTTDDPQGRKTVLDLVRKATQERVYPVGRLDRNTSGVLLLTNDGDLSQKLTHPSNEIRKVYHVTLNKPLEKKDFEQILKGVKLEDGLASVDVLAYADIKDKTQIGVEIHSGRNRIVRRLFEALGYDVRNLDRVIFAGLTKKNVERGKWRFLSEKEVRDLKHFKKGR